MRQYISTSLHIWVVLQRPSVHFTGRSWEQLKREEPSRYPGRWQHIVQVWSEPATRGPASVPLTWSTLMTTGTSEPAQVPLLCIEDGFTAPGLGKVDTVYPRLKQAEAAWEEDGAQSVSRRSGSAGRRARCRRSIRSEVKLKEPEIASMRQYINTSLHVWVVLQRPSVHFTGRSWEQLKREELSRYPQKVTATVSDSGQDLGDVDLEYSHDNRNL
ncbi:uncharacterized protein LOC127468242 [Manacus candei]|uniref:uncharacterized protein LOC127468242 n=1 Tax=Manacus candei TaxID=415023 RepID=UPI002227C2D5|nr:uncharacterized protein LOC127468242 [Manacus candei]